MGLAASQIVRSIGGLCKGVPNAIAAGLIWALATPIIAACKITLACPWPLLRLLSRFENRQIALH